MTGSISISTTAARAAVPSLPQMLKELAGHDTGPLVLRVAGLSSDREPELYSIPRNIDGLKSVVNNLNAKWESLQFALLARVSVYEG